MDEDREKDDSRRNGNQFTLLSNGLSSGPWHSTPVKKPLEKSSIAGRSQVTSNPVPSLSFMHNSKTAAFDLEMSTIEKQRTEMQLLISELKDRDQELNTMAAAHHSQLQAWEQDRQRVLSLEQRCGRLEDELRKRNEVIRAISKRLKIVELQEKEGSQELSTSRQQLKEMTQRQEHSRQQRYNLEETTQRLNTTVMTLSSQVGQLQVHEEELNSMLKLKDKDLMEATSHILGLTSRLQESESSLKESQERVSKLLREAEEYKRRFRESRYTNAQLKDELQEKTIENNSQREELIRLKQENQLLRKELALAGEGESWKDELLGLARSKQERTESELLCLRQVCEKQQNDLQLLKFNLESSRETLRQYECQKSRDSPLDVTCLFVDYPISSPQSTRSPASAEEPAFSVKIGGSQEEYTSSTSRLKRLLAESQQMVASLDRSAGKCQSPTPSHTSHCNLGCSLHDNHINGYSHNHSQSPTTSLGENLQVKVVDSEVQSNQQISETVGCGQQSP